MSSDRTTGVSAMDALARYPALAPLLAVDGDAWQFCDFGPDLTGRRLTPTTIAALWIGDTHNAGAVRVRTSADRAPVTEVDFAGPLDDAVRLLAEPS